MIINYKNKNNQINNQIIKNKMIKKWELKLNKKKKKILFLINQKKKHKRFKKQINKLFLTIILLFKIT